MHIRLRTLFNSYWHWLLFVIAVVSACSSLLESCSGIANMPLGHPFIAGRGDKADEVAVIAIKLRGLNQIVGIEAVHQGPNTWINRDKCLRLELPPGDYSLDLLFGISDPLGDTARQTVRVALQQDHIYVLDGYFTTTSTITGVRYTTYYGYWTGTLFDKSANAEIQLRSLNAE